MTAFTAFSGLTPPWNLVSLDANFTLCANLSIANTFAAQNNFSVDQIISSQTIGAGGGSPSNSCCFGNSALSSNTTGNFNAAFGVSALLSNTTGGNSVAVGFDAMVLNTTGGASVAVGSYTLNAVTNQNYNTGVGYYALHASTGGSNTAVGANAGVSSTSGSSNIFIGNSSGGSVALTGSYNTYIGNCFPSGTSVTNEIVISTASSAAAGKGSNTIVFGTTSTTTLYCEATTITSLSDERDKEDFEPLPVGLYFVLDLEPSFFTWNTRDGAKVGIPAAGFSAQKLLAVQEKYGAGNLDLVDNRDAEHLSARYGNLIPVLVKAIQELKSELDEVRALTGV